VPNGYITRVEPDAWEILIVQGYTPPSPLHFKEFDWTNGTSTNSQGTTAWDDFALWHWQPSWTRTDTVDTANLVRTTIHEDIVLLEKPETQFLYAWGKLTQSAGGTSVASAATWEGDVRGVGAKVIKVPKFLYADAAADFPVKFTIFGFDSGKVIVDALTVTIYAAGQSVSSVNIASNIALDEGLGPVPNNTTGANLSDTYTAWVPIELIRGINIAGDTTDDVYISVAASVREYGEGLAAVEVASCPALDTIPWTSPTSGRPQALCCNPLIFGDLNVRVIDIAYNPTSWTNPGNNTTGFAKLWSVNDQTTKQTRIHTKATGSKTHSADWELVIYINGVPSLLSKIIAA